MLPFDARSVAARTRRIVPAAIVLCGLSAGTVAQETPPTGAGITPFGAIRAGDSRDYVTEWTGGLAEPVKGYVPGKPHPDPFSEDARWFTVTQAEMERYKVRLSAGLQALLGRHSSFEVPVFQTRRTAAAPQAVYDATQNNARTARLADNGLSVSGTSGGIPFPIPGSGAEAMWNHVLRWRGGTVTRNDGVVLPDSYGQLAVRMFREEILSANGLGLPGPDALYYRRTGVRPDAVAGALLIHETLDPLVKPRAVWYRRPGDTRVLRAPDFSADTPDPASDGIRTADMLDMFSGTLDRFSYRLVGRRSMYVPYNAYRLDAANLVPQDFLWAVHPNPNFLRYELHRVWIVEATLKSGYRHAFPSRVYYLDEDSWQIVMADHFAADGRIARYAEAHGATYSQVPVFAPAAEITYDLAANRYVISGMDNQAAPPVYGRPMKPADFAPDTLRPRDRWQ